MSFPPLPNSAQDTDRLLLLSICHFILAGLSVLGLGFLVVHYMLMSTIFANPHIWDHMKDAQGNPVQMPFDPTQFFGIFKWLYLLIGAWGVASIILNLMAGMRLRQWRSRTFLIVVAAVNCINLPIGTVVGVFTLLALTRDSVRMRFAAEATAHV